MKVPFILQLPRQRSPSQCDTSPSPLHCPLLCLQWTHGLAKQVLVFTLYFLPHCKGRRVPHHCINSTNPVQGKCYFHTDWSRTLSTVSVDLVILDNPGSEEASSNIRLPAAVLPEEFSSKSFPITLRAVIFQPQAKSISGWNLHLGKQHSNVRTALINRSDSIFYTNAFQVHS